MSEFYDEKVYNKRDTTYSNRYRKCSILTDKETGEVLLATRELKPAVARSTDYIYRVTTLDCNRLDLIAEKYYNNPLLWWVIAETNEIYDPFKELPIGTLIRVPRVETLYDKNSVIDV